MVDLVDESDLESKLAFEQGVLKEHELPHGNSGRKYMQNNKKKQEPKVSTAKPQRNAGVP